MKINLFKILCIRIKTAMIEENFIYCLPVLPEKNPTWPKEVYTLPEGESSDKHVFQNGKLWEKSN